MECRRSTGDQWEPHSGHVGGVVPLGVDEPRLTGLLGLPRADRDPVTIITAAQVRLRRWRRVLNSAAGRRVDRRTVAATSRIRQIAEARDALLLRACGASLPGHAE